VGFIPCSWPCAVLRSIYLGWILHVLYLNVSPVLSFLSHNKHCTIASIIDHYMFMIVRGLKWSVGRQPFFPVCSCFSLRETKALETNMAHYRKVSKVCCCWLCPWHLTECTFAGLLSCLLTVFPLLLRGDCLSSLLAKGKTEPIKLAPFYSVWEWPWEGTVTYVSPTHWSRGWSQKKHKQEK